MGKTFNQISKMEDNGKYFIMDLWKRAKEQGLDSNEIHDRWRKYSEQTSLNDFPRYVRSYLSGVYDCMKALCTRDDIEFCYFVEGTRYSIRKESDMYYEDHGITPQELHEKQEKHKGFYWIESGKFYC
jgi:hypothetical protein